MSKFINRLIAYVIKEFLVIVREPYGYFILIVPTIVQFLVLSVASTMEVKNVALVILNQDHGRHGYELIRRISGSPTFTKINFVQNANDFKPYIDQQKAIAAIYIPQDFSKNTEAGRTSKLQIILDGRRSNAAQIVNGYLIHLITDYDQEIQKNKHGNFTQISVSGRNWFNANLLYLWFTVPYLVMSLAMIIALCLTALSIARERELGTFDQMLVSPLMLHEILLGKMIPAMVIGLAEGVLLLVVGILIFKVPFTGSFLLFLFSLFVFLLAVVSIGIFISAISKTQQQAILGANIFIGPAIALSGYAAPVENMPQWLQTITWVNPIKYALIVTKGIFLKNMSFVEVWANIWPLLIVSAFMLLFAGWVFCKRSE